MGGNGELLGLGAVRSGVRARPDGGAPPGSVISPAGGAGSDPPGADDPGNDGVAGRVGAGGTTGRPVLGTALVAVGGELFKIGGVIS